jgi:Cof subfamily protein (haloacid dehalogenase superfamily)
MLLRLVLLLIISIARGFAIKSLAEINFPSNFDIQKACILCDMDGTLLSSNHDVSDENLAAIKEALASGWKFIPATGRTRGSMRNAVGQDIVNQLFGDISHAPGVYQQGLMVYGLNGELIYERQLTNDVITIAVEFCKSKDVSVVAYASDQIFCETRNSHTDRVLEYKDPAPEVFPSGLDQLAASGVIVHKLIILTDPENIAKIREEIEPFLQGRATLTQAVPDMLEILPLGGCKGDGVKRFLDHIGVKPEDTIAFGDGENDVEVAYTL